MYPLDHTDAFDSMSKARKSISEGQEFGAKRDLGKRLRESGGQLTEDMMQDFVSQWGK